MKKSIAFKLFAFALLALMVSSCSKYEEGSKFTVLTKKQRAVNTWTMTTYTVGGTSVMQAGTTVVWDLAKDGSATVSYTNGAGTISESGTWAFNSDKSSLVITGITGYEGTFEIVKLKNKELKLRQVETIGIVEVTSIWEFTGA